MSEYLEHINLFRMSNRPANSRNEGRRPASRRPHESTPDILTLLNSKMGCDQLQREIMDFINNNKWFAIGHALDALEEDILLLSIFSTIYTAKPDGRSISFLAHRFIRMAYNWRKFR